ncbi:MAG: hypothetical protein V5A59_14135 [Bacteroidales bacterium]
MEQKEKQQLKERFGTIPNETGLKLRTRIHQGWWRMNVLNEKPGKHPKDRKNNVCSTISDGMNSKKNFLTANTVRAAEKTIAERQELDSGLMEQDRLYNNLLSSQPLCFNFFGELMMDTDFGLTVLQNWWPELTKLKRVVFEYAPEERFTDDNSAFDIAFDVKSGDKTGLIGLECKYTDTFSTTEYDKSAYREIFKKSRSFAARYEELKVNKYNQLFRNQLIADALIQNKKYDFVKTGLFCYQQDESAIKTAKELQNMLSNPDSFTIITYSDFIVAVQRLDLDWQKREWTMLLWARYCATDLSKALYEQLEE